MDIVFLTLAEILEIHRDQVERYGGSAGIRDLGLLQSALASPSAGVSDRYLHDDLFGMAAAYFFHITQNHPFVDGNKRTGAVAALVFLILNGVTVTAGENDLEKAVLGVASGEWEEIRIAEFFRHHSRPVSDADAADS